MCGASVWTVKVSKVVGEFMATLYEGLSCFDRLNNSGTSSSSRCKSTK